MTDYLESVWSRLTCGDDETLLDALVDLAELLDQWSLDDRKKISRLREIRSHLIDLYRSKRSSDIRGAIVWCLGKFKDDDLKPFFKQVLSQSLNQDSAVLWQAIISLDNLGENLTRGGGSSRDVATNNQIAREYLRNHPSDEEE